MQLLSDNYPEIFRYEKEMLRFITAEEVPFTKYFSRIRGFISTCRKHGISPAKALKDLFLGIYPDFINSQFEKMPE